MKEFFGNANMGFVCVCISSCVLARMMIKRQYLRISSAYLMHIHAKFSQSQILAILVISIK